MALATQCPHCGTTFRVASDQLKLRGGIVRCGACQEIFDGNATLIDLDALAIGQAPERSAPDPAVAPTQAETAFEPSPTAPAPQPDGEPIYTLDFDHTFDPLGILPKVAQAAEPKEETAPPSEPDMAASAHGTPVTEPALGEEEAPAAAPDPAEPHLAEPRLAEPKSTPPPEPEPLPEEAVPQSSAEAPASQRTEPAFGLPVDEELIAAPLPNQDDAPFAAPLPMRESADGPAAPPAAAQVKTARQKQIEQKAMRRSKLTPTKITQPKLRLPDIDEPEFVKRGRQREQSGKTHRLLMAAGSAMLLLALGVQAVTGLRNVLAARFPAAKPALVSACALLGCRVELPAQIDNLVIETGELATLGASGYSLTTLLRNQGSLVQAWPSIELTLTDADDKPLLRRVFAPREYLPQDTPLATGFGARSEQPVKLYFLLDQLKPSGYHIAVFYP